MIWGRGVSENSRTVRREGRKNQTGIQPKDKILYAVEMPKKRRIRVRSRS